jgi:hypothetical protein
MKFLTIVFFIICLIIPAYAMDDSLKDIAFRYNVEMTSYPFCNTGSTSTCSTCDVSNEVYEPVRRSAVAIFERDGYEFWLTAADAVTVNYTDFFERPDRMPLISVDGQPAKIERIMGGLALLSTPNYSPFLGDIKYNSSINFSDKLFYEDVTKKGTVTKLDIKALDAYFIETNTAPDPENIGAGVFNMYGELIGIVVGPAKIAYPSCSSCSSCEPDPAGTRIIRITEEWFK